MVFSPVVIMSGDALTWNEALSGIFGSISLAAWIFVLIPQLVENYRLQSADGISLVFLSVWFLGDITNLIGAIWAGLVPTVIALAIYFCFADCLLILQCLYYNHLNKRRGGAKPGQQASGGRLDASQAGNGEQPTYAEVVAHGGTEHEPLLPGNSHRRKNSIGLPGSHRRRRSSAASSSDGTARRQSQSHSGLAQIDEEDDSNGWSWIGNTLSVLAVCAIGAAGWLIAYKTGLWEPTKADDHESKPGTGGGDMGDLPMAIGAQVLGYASAVAYLGARIPQIVKNQREKSCEGLSLLFFMLSLLGNASYGAGILFHSVERSYVLTNLPWLIGSIGTIAEDGLIFVQFHAFRKRVRDSAVDV